MSRVARLGAFIFGALLILTFIVFRIGDKDFLFSTTYRLQAPFDNVAGLGNGAEVRLGGFAWGPWISSSCPRTQERKSSSL